jgi:hypothetical protein
MRTIDEFRKHKLKFLKDAIRRPGLFGDPDVWCDYLLRDLCYIDQHEVKLKLEWNKLKMQKRFGCLGLSTPFQQLLGGRDFGNSAFNDEVASIYAEMAYHLGYLNVERTLSDTEYTVLSGQLQQFKKGKWRQSDILARYGKPSLIIGGSYHSCSCYAPVARNKDWVFFDFVLDQSGYRDVVRDKSGGRLPEKIEGIPRAEHPDCSDVPLRDVRVPGANLDGFIFTPYGMRIRKAMEREIRRGFAGR